VKWVIVVVVFILAAPTIAKRLEALNPENRDNPDNPAKRADGKRRGIVYRSVRRFGLRKTFVAFVIILAILAAAVYLLIRRF